MDTHVNFTPADAAAPVSVAPATNAYLLAKQGETTGGGQADRLAAFMAEAEASPHKGSGARFEPNDPAHGFFREFGIPLYELGYEPLPIMPPGASLTHLGKVVPFDNSGRVPGWCSRDGHGHKLKWKQQAKRSKILDWTKRLAGIAIRAGGEHNVAGLDIDTPDVVLSATLHALAERIFGPLPIVRSRDGTAKRLIMIRIDEPTRPRKLIEADGPRAGKIAVELLTTGHSFTILGRHRDGKLYRFEQASPLSCRARDLPGVTTEQLNEFFVEGAKLGLIDDGVRARAAGAGHAHGTRSQTTPAAPEALTALIACIPAEAMGTYADWLRMLMALHTAGGTLEQAHALSERTGSAYNANEVDAKWDDLERNNQRKVGLGTLIKAAGGMLGLPVAVRDLLNDRGEAPDRGSLTNRRKPLIVDAPKIERTEADIARLALTDSVDLVIDHAAQYYILTKQHKYLSEIEVAKQAAISNWTDEEKLEALEHLGSQRDGLMPARMEFIAVTAGAGKSRAIAERLSRPLIVDNIQHAPHMIMAMRVVIYVANHDLATEVKARSIEFLPTDKHKLVHHIGAKCGNDELSMLVSDVKSGGGDFRKAVCRKCPMQKGCELFEEGEIDATQPGLYIVPSSHWNTTGKFRIENPDFAIIDDAPGAALNQKHTINLNEIAKSIDRPARMADGLEATLSLIEDYRRELVRALRTMIVPDVSRTPVMIADLPVTDDLTINPTLIKSLRSHLKIERDVEHKLSQALTAEAKAIADAPAPTNGKRRGPLWANTEILRCRQMIALLETLARYVERNASKGDGRSPVDIVVANDDVWIEFYDRSERLADGIGVPLIVLDATPDLSGYLAAAHQHPRQRPAFERPVGVTNIAADLHEQSVIIQLTDSYASKAALWGRGNADERADRAKAADPRAAVSKRRTLRNFLLAAPGATLGLVTNKDGVELLDVGGVSAKQLLGLRDGDNANDAHYAAKHFGKQRGSNALEDMSTLLMLGQHLLPSDQLDLEARARRAQLRMPPLTEVAPVVLVPVAHELADGRHAVGGFAFRGMIAELTDTIMASCSAEAIQAAHRGRPLNKPTVIIAETSEPLGHPVAKFVPGAVLDVMNGLHVIAQLGVVATGRDTLLASRVAGLLPGQRGLRPILAQYAAPKAAPDGEKAAGAFALDNHIIGEGTSRFDKTNPDRLVTTSPLAFCHTIPTAAQSLQGLLDEHHLLRHVWGSWKPGQPEHDCHVWRLYHRKSGNRGGFWVNETVHPTGHEALIERIYGVAAADVVATGLCHTPGLTPAAREWLTSLSEPEAPVAPLHSRLPALTAGAPMLPGERIVHAGEHTTALPVPESFGALPVGIEVTPTPAAVEAWEPDLAIMINGIEHRRKNAADIAAAAAQSAVIAANAAKVRAQGVNPYAHAKSGGMLAEAKVKRRVKVIRRAQPPADLCGFMAGGAGLFGGGGRGALPARWRCL